MTVVKWRGKWCVDYRREDGTRVRRVAPVQSRRGAAEYEAVLRGGSSMSMPCSTGAETGGAVPTLGEFAPEWLTTYAAVNNKPSEVIAKEVALRVHLLPFFGNSRKLDTFTPRDVEAFKAAKLAEGLSPKTINNHLTVLRKLLVTAEEWEFIDRVPRIRRLKVAPARYDWLSRDESERFLQAIERHYPQWKAVFWIALRTGLRRGEIFGLHWSDVDLVARHLTVRYGVYRGRLSTPKNGRTRTIPLTRGLTEVLREHQAVTRLRGDLLFPGEEGGLTRHLDHVDRPLKGALRLAGLRKIRFHDLRHSFASQLVSAGRPLKEVQELLGHGSITMTMRYAHLAPDRMREAVDVLEEPIDRAAGTG
jgi:integrase